MEETKTAIEEVILFFVYIFKEWFYEIYLILEKYNLENLIKILPGGIIFLAIIKIISFIKRKIK